MEKTRTFNFTARTPDRTYQYFQMNDGSPLALFLRAQDFVSRQWPDCDQIRAYLSNDITAEIEGLKVLSKQFIYHQVSVFKIDSTADELAEACEKLFTERIKEP